MLEFDFKIKVGSFDLHARGRQNVARIGLFGPSGCGKTTLLSCLAGLLCPQSGFISLNGKALFDSAAKHFVPPHRRSIGYVFQDGRLFPHMTVRANIGYGRGNKDGPSLNELCEVLDLEGLLEQRPQTLSAGEAQRVALARALAAAPTLLLLDEPLASIDEAARLRILPYLEQVYKNWHIPFVYVSHSLSEIIFLAEMSWRMSRGKIDRCLLPLDLLAKSSHVDPIQNILEGSVNDVLTDAGFAKVSCGSQVLKVPSDGLRCGDNVTVALPARDLMLSLSPPQGISARNVLSAKIVEMEQNGSALWIITETGNQQLIVELTADAGRELDLRQGMPVFVVAKSHSIIVSSLNERRHREE